MLIWVTGLSGTGKSAIAEGLRELGHWSVDADDDGMSSWRSHDTGDLVASPPIARRRAGWLEEHDWVIDVTRVQRLRHEAENRHAFLLGAVANEEEVLPLADVVICLVADAATLTRRLVTRGSNDFGQAPGDIEAVLSWLGRYEDRHRGIGAAMVDATQPLADVIADVLAAARRAS